MNTRRIGWFAIGVVIMAMVVLLAVTVVRTTTVVDLIRADQKPNIARAQQTQENTDQIKALAQTIKSCTDPTGDCFKSQQTRTGEAIGSITDFNIYLAVCEKRAGVDTVPEFKACVQELLVMASRHS